MRNGLLGHSWAIAGAKGAATLARAAAVKARRRMVFLRFDLAASIPWALPGDQTGSRFRFGHGKPPSHAAGPEVRAGTDMAGRLTDRVAIGAGAGSSGPGWSNGKCTPSPSPAKAMRPHFARQASTIARTSTGQL